MEKGWFGTHSRQSLLCDSPLPDEDLPELWEHPPPDTHTFKDTAALVTCFSATIAGVTRFLPVSAHAKLTLVSPCPVKHVFLCPLHVIRMQKTVPQAHQGHPQLKAGRSRQSRHL